MPLEPSALPHSYIFQAGGSFKLFCEPPAARLFELQSYKQQSLHERSMPPACFSHNQKVWLLQSTQMYIC
jgi:hypothetical protein